MQTVKSANGVPCHCSVSGVPGAGGNRLDRRLKKTDREVRFVQTNRFRMFQMRSDTVLSYDVRIIIFRYPAVNAIRSWNVFRKPWFRQFTGSEVVVSAWPVTARVYRTRRGSHKCFSRRPETTLHKNDMQLSEAKKKPVKLIRRTPPNRPVFIVSGREFRGKMNFSKKKKITRVICGLIRLPSNTTVGSANVTRFLSRE